MNPPTEKRKTARAPVSVRIDYSTVDQIFWDFARNINEGGLFVESNRPLDVGTRVHLKFYLPGLKEPIETSGEVVWVNVSQPSSETSEEKPIHGKMDSTQKPGMGIQFIDLKESDKAAINQLVRELRKNQK